METTPTGLGTDPELLERRDRSEHAQSDRFSLCVCVRHQLSLVKLLVVYRAP